MLQYANCLFALFSLHALVLALLASLSAGRGPMRVLGYGITGLSVLSLISQFVVFPAAPLSLIVIKSAMVVGALILMVAAPRSDTKHIALILAFVAGLLLFLQVWPGS